MRWIAVVLMLALPLTAPAGSAVAQGGGLQPPVRLTDGFHVDEIIAGDEDGTAIVRGTVQEPGGPAREEFICDRRGHTMIVRNEPAATQDLYPVASPGLCDALVRAARQRASRQ